MADPMTAFRRLLVDGPGVGSNDPLWQASLDLGYEAGAPANDPLLRSDSIRVLLQRASTRKVHIQGKTDVYFQEPMLLATAATTVDFRNNPSGAPFVKIGKAQFTPFPLADQPATVAAVPASRYAELRVAPKSPWPPTDDAFTMTNGVFELGAPRLAATRGHIHVGCARDAEPKAGDPADKRYALTRLLAIDWAIPGKYVKMFGGLFVARRKTKTPVTVHGVGAVSDAVAFDLTPEGVEFDALVPDPFAASTTDQIDITTALSLRLRLVVFDSGDGLSSLQLELVGQYISSAPGAVAPFTYLNTKLASLTRNLAQQGCLLIQADTGNIPPLAWPLVVGSNAGSPVWTCENPQGIPTANLVPAVRLLENAVTARLLTRQDFGGSEPGVAEFSRHKTMLAARRPSGGFVLSIQSQARDWTPGATDPASPDVTLTWSSETAINPDKVKVSTFSGIVESAPLAARLQNVWAQSGAVAPDARPPYAFLALERGWVQMPLPPVSSDPISVVAADSAFRGFLRLATGTDKIDSPTNDPMSTGIEIVAAQNILVTVTWTKPDIAAPRTIVAVLNSAAGTLDGALWSGEASPSPTDVLPPLDAGPAALASIPIAFGVSGPGNWSVTVDAFTESGPGTIRFPLPLLGSATNPVLVWQPHPTLALVSSISMTRTAESAMRPSATRELVPSEVVGSAATPLVLSFVTSDGIIRRLPRVDVAKLPSPATAHGDGRWRWPWPKTTGEGRDSCLSSPLETAGVALASLTLPGIEFTAATDANLPTADNQMRVSLRFDLPILDELFANAKAPETTPPAAPQPVTAPKGSNLPTALDMVALSGVWSENARRLARARTEADRVVLLERTDGAGNSVVDLWHPLSGVTGSVVRGIAEPYVWKPATFSFSALPMMPNNVAYTNINLGSYCLGAGDAWQFGPGALGGLPGTTSFEISGNELKLIPSTSPPGPIRVNGFAASSFPSADPAEPAVAHLQDARGLSLAKAPDLISQPELSSRAAMLRAAPADQSLMLATLRQPAQVKIGGMVCSFWFRDLPLQQNPDTLTPNASRLVFDRSGGLETGFGPDPTAINRNRLARTLYEWSFFGPPEPGATEPKPKPSRGRFEFDLAGPLAALPLRLLDVGFAADGHLQELAILVSVQYRSPPPDGMDVAPFAAETIYATGNLVKMSFETDPDPKVPTGSLRLKAMERCELKDPSDLTAAADPFVISKKRVSLVSDMTVNHGPSGYGAFPTSDAQLTFEFEPGVSGNAPDIAAANVRVRLFGQDCNLDTRDAGFTADGLKATFAAPAGQNDLLNLKTMQLIWSRNADGTPATPQWYLCEGELGIPLRDEANSPIAVKRIFDKDGKVQWLGLPFANAGADEVVDHDLGVITMRFQTEVSLADDPVLFRGMLLPDGELLGAVAVVFKKNYAPDGAKWPSWPRPGRGSVFAEFAFDAKGASDLPQRITAIRHRHRSAVNQDNTPSWRSRLLIDAAFAAPRLNTSSVSWPVGRVAVAIPAGSDPATRAFSDPADIRFNPDAAVPGDWKAKLQVNGTDDPAHPALVLSHRVTPRICAHELPTDLLSVDADGAVILNSPWLFRAVVDHVLQPSSGTWPGQPGSAEFTWTSIDELALFDMIQLVESAKLAPNPDSDRYAFLARYKDNASAPDIRIAGVARRALADAGFPVEYVMQALKASAPKPSLVLTGAAVTEVVTSATKPDLGVPLVLQWILPWAPLKNDADGKDTLGVLSSCPQTDDKVRTYDIALYDAAAGAVRPLDGSPVCSFAAQDGTQRLIEARMSAIVGGGRARTMVAVDQAILQPVATSVALLSRPLFPRTLLGLSAVAKAFGALAQAPGAPFGSRISCVTTRDDVPADGSGLRLAKEVRFSVTAWKPGQKPDETPAPAVSMIVADDIAIHTAELPSAMAQTLVDPSDNTVVGDGTQRADAEMRALGLSAGPRVIILASVDSSYLTIHDTGQPSQAVTTGLPHVSWLVTKGAQPALAVRRARTLRKMFDTIYASPALGWPSAPRADEIAKAHADLGEEEVRRNDQAWAGRVRSVAWPAIAWDRSAVLTFKEKTNEDGVEKIRDKTVEGEYSPDDAAEVGRSAFVTAGQRVALRRAAARNLRSAPDRLSVLAPPRARAPTVDAMTGAFRQARNPVPSDTSKAADRPGFAPMLPGAIEATVTGQRPGVLLTQFEGLLLTSSMVPFDPEFNRFGRPAWRAPLTVHQVRTPRSSALPETSDLVIRRKTYVAADEVGQDNKLKTFKVVLGPAQVVRFDHGANSPHAITIAVQSPKGGRLAADWDGKIRLVATVPSASPSAAVALTRIGLLPRAGTGSPRCELAVGNTLVVFAKLTWGFDPDNKPATDPTRLPVVLEGAQGTEIQAAVAQALNNASADTPVRLTIRGTTPMDPLVDDPVVQPTGSIPLDPAAVTDLIPGPPHVLVFNLPHIPSRQRWLPVETFTLAFGDPAYDRELGSPTTSYQYAIADVPHWLAVDRAEYDPSAKIYLAFWKRQKGPDKPPEDPLPKNGWSLTLQIVPRDGSPARQLQIAATNLLDPPPAKPRYRVQGRQPYAIALSSLREPFDPKTPAADVPVQFAAGDRLQVTVSNEADATQILTLDVGIIAEPVLPPPAATYGLATLHRLEAAVGAGLFATAPLPQAIDFPDLLNDLYAGHVRRRGFFLWPLTANDAPEAGKQYSYLVKVDRTGGGQLPSKHEDFQVYEN
ncbi:hypothetical protein [Bradyrhizobium quebecense]|uniref:Uncharacterized protein n=2 Tax=Bradyrhizobium quebecense TaxID=2748629 RepID=A0ABS3MTB9_9BRAD|nr:hypothetical protein [Bradyrhizobium quebecense]UGY02528.1 hypothetical protein J4P68_0036515 [Bradyrhizobium quebecense]